jgi:hypothetical protein
MLTRGVGVSICGSQSHDILSDYPHPLAREVSLPLPNPPALGSKVKASPLTYEREMNLRVSNLLDSYLYRMRMGGGTGLLEAVSS